MKTVIEMAREVDPVTKIILDRRKPQGMNHDVFMWFLERFADLIRADEREACAKVCEDLDAWNMYDPASTAIKAIRARGSK